MSRKRCRPEEIIAKLREADVLLCQGGSVGDRSNPANWFHPERAVSRLIPTLVRPTGQLSNSRRWI